MTVTRPFHMTPKAYLVAERPDDPVLFLSPEILAATARQFIDGFPGLVTYAVKANAAGPVIENLARAGLTAFDVASPAEIALVRSIAPEAALHYNNPVRSRAEIDAAIGMGVTSYSVDDAGEFAKLVEEGVAPGAEMTVRFKLPVAGAAYDFGEKFGATPEAAADLLRAVAKAGYRPSLTFHPGTQCTDPAAWVAYIDASAGIARAAGVTLDRLNVGGGFPSRRMQADTPPLEAIFRAIDGAVARAFGTSRPALICEPGRAMVAEAVSLALRVKALRPGMVYLNDGIYGALAEQPVMGMTDRLGVVAPDGRPRSGAPVPRLIWGPTCDSLDRMPGAVPLPEDMAEGDYVLIHGMGAYSTATVTRFNGYGAMRLATVRSLS
ncbi:Ornithine decarboxylase / Arginine decarboxylase [Roseibacterium elongatum DSM 19469]|uniref:ornithine decarboxylase n=1 Tax=Roseicyclus elongatus DSM 19469 TaxID=1294273 RepID=W8S5N4_9RHOB|nr:type III PLP-dependent enzyme [Roseibacterium elongatum]AHM04146.1 Ornithine decarboxylase / Arginine decarboxylase [Roseibacterium elongatum DSM 19469]